MIFRQKILKEEKIKFAILNLCVTLPWIILIFVSLRSKEEFKTMVGFTLIAYLPLFILSLILSLKNLEWYDVFEDRIEAKGIGGIKNIVYFKDVIYIEETIVNLTTRGMKKQFYIFNDGRQNNNNIFNLNSCYNKRKFNLKIYKTSKLENYIKNSMQIEIRNIKTSI